MVLKLVHVGLIWLFVTSFAHFPQSASGANPQRLQGNVTSFANFRPSFGAKPGNASSVNFRQSAFGAKSEQQRAGADLRACDNPAKKASGKEYTYVRRGLDSLHCFIPTWSDWHTKKVEVPSEVSKGLRILEIGTGTARALLELNFRNPLIELFGTNKISYSKQQVLNPDKDMWQVARDFDIQVLCDSNRKPIWPKIIMQRGGIQQEPLPVPAGSLDFVITRFALGVPKVQPWESHLALQRVLPALKEGGTAIMHLAKCFSADKKWNSQQWVMDFGKDFGFSLLNVANIGQSVSILFILNHNMDQAYEGRNGGCKQGSAQCTSIIMKKCARDAVRHPVTKDCVIPPDVTMPVVASRGWFHKTSSTNAYVANYWKHLTHQVDAWVKKGSVTPIQDRKPTAQAENNRGKGSAGKWGQKSSGWGQSGAGGKRWAGNNGFRRP